MQHMHERLYTLVESLLGELRLGNRCTKCQTQQVGDKRCAETN